MKFFPMRCEGCGAAGEICQTFDRSQTYGLCFLILAKRGLESLNEEHLVRHGFETLAIYEEADEENR